MLMGFSLVVQSDVGGYTKMEHLIFIQRTSREVQAPIPVEEQGELVNAYYTINVRR